MELINGEWIKRNKGSLLTLVKDMHFLAMQLANMGHEHKIFRQRLKLICSLLLNKTLE